MKSKTIRCLAAAAAIAWAAAQSALAGFRVAEAPQEARSMALMAIQSAGDASAETVETTTPEAPFTVDFAALGVQDPSKAYLMIVNEDTGNAVALSATDGESSLELPPLALAELEMRYLGAGQQYHCMAMEAVDGGADEILGSQLIASAQSEVEFPDFAYLAADGTVAETHLTDRVLVGVGKKKPNLTMQDPADAGQLAEMEEIRGQMAYYAYSYELPNGATYSYDEASAVSGGSAPAAGSDLFAESVTFGDLKFDIWVFGATKVKNATTNQVHKAILRACEIWSSAVQGSCPVEMRIAFSNSKEDFPSDGILAFSASPPDVFDNGIYYPSTLYNQTLGEDAFPDNYDVTLTFNANFTDADWCKKTWGVDATYYFGLDGKPGPYQQDFITVILHEVCHGMGFADNIFYTQNPYYAGFNGCFYGLDYVGSSYDYPNVYSRYLSYKGKRLPELTWAERTKAILSEALYWDGPNVKKVNNGNPVRMFAPASYQGGSSVSHWDDEVMDSHKVFMTWQHHYPLHEIAPLEAAMMKDLGWRLNSDKPVLPAAPTGVTATKGTKVGQIDVGWNSSEGATSYTVYKSSSASGTYSPVAQGLALCKYSDTGVSGTKTNWYKVAASNAAGLGPMSDYAYGFAKVETVITNIALAGPATLTSGGYGDYTATAYYSDKSTKDVTKLGTWTLPYGSAYASLSGSRLTAGKLTEQQQATLQYSYTPSSGTTLTRQKTVAILPQTVTVSFDAGSYGKAEFASREYVVGAKYGTLPKVTGVPTGKEFKGWFSASSGGSEIKETSTVVGSVTKLWAQYVDVDVVSKVWVDVPETVEWGKTAQAKCFVTLNGSDRQWTGETKWQISDSGSGLHHSLAGNVVTVSADEGAKGSVSIAAMVKGIQSGTKVVRALAPTATLTLDPNGGTVSPATLQATRGSAISGLPTPIRDKHDFKGWYTAKTGGTLVKDGTVYDGTYTTLFARWERKVELASVSISGPATLASGATATYSCTAKYTDGSTQSGVAASWSASAGTMDGGAYTAPGVTAETTVRIQASYTSQGVTKDAELAVKVAPKTVKVSFDAAGGKADYADKTYTVGLKYGELPGAAWDKYHGFDGWFTAAGIDGRHVTPDTVADENVTTLVAQWHDIVLLESLAVAGPSSVLPGEAILAQMKCTAKYSDGSSKDVTGQTQWSVAKGSEWIDGDGKAKLVTENTAVTVKAEFGGLSKTFNVTIRPKKVAVAFDAHGGTAEFASREYVVGGTYRPLPKAEKAYNQFLGWFTAETGGGRVVETTVVAESAATLHAQWEENPAELVKIALSASPATVVAGGSSVLACTATWSKGGTTSDSALGAAEVEWSLAPESAGSVKDGVFTAARVTEETACTVTAAYQGKTAEAQIAVRPETVEVAFDANGGTVAEASRTYVVGKAYGSFPSATPPDAVHHFDGWFTAKDGGVRATEATVCEKSVAALFAHWTEERHLTGVRVEGPASVTSGGTAEFACFGLYSDGTEVGAKPDSWSAGPASAGSISQDGVFTAALVPAAAAATVTASLEGLTGSAGITVEPLTVSVRFDPCDGAVSPERKSFVVGSPYGELPVPTRARYDFDAWYTRPAKAGDKVDAATTASAEVTELFAGWTPTPTTLTGIRIAGPEVVRSGEYAVYACKAVYADGSEGSVVPVWSLVAGLDYGSLTLTGRFEANETDTERKVTIQAVYTDKGVRYEDRLDVTVTPAALVVDPPALSLESGAQKAEIQVDSFGDWTVETDSPWIVLGKTSGSGIDTVPFSVEANPGAEERTGTITVKGSGLEAKCVVKQYSAVPEEYVAVTLDPAIPGLEPSQRQYVKGRKFGFLPQPVRQGYFFGGWWTGEDGTGTRVHALSIVGDDTLSLFGFWQGMDVAHALNNALDWVEDPVHPWVFDYMESVDRKVSMAAPSLANRDSASLTVLVEGPGTVSFYWKASSEEFFDTLSLYVDGRFVASTSGDTPWQAMSRAVSGFGQHVLTWTYAKDGQGASGMDCAWLDLVTWLPDYAGAGASSIQSADGRAVPETWLNAYGLDTGEESLDEDADGDGMTNFEEFVAGTDPTDPDSVLLVYLDMDGEGRPVIGSVPPAGASGNRTYVIEGKTSLDEGDWEDADEAVHRFFRVRAVAP